MPKYRLLALAGTGLAALALSLGCGKETPQSAQNYFDSPVVATAQGEPVLTIDGKPDLLWEGKAETDLIKRSTYFIPVRWSVDRECINRLTEEYNGNSFFVRASPASEGDKLRGFFVYVTRTFAGYSGMDSDIRDIGLRCTN